jgi:hypothetical protein
MMDPTVTQRAEAAVQLLEQVLSGATPPDLALERWPSIEAEDDELLVLTGHDLSHFAADGDIRARDRAYAEYQAQLLTRRLREIREKFGLGQS